MHQGGLLPSLLHYCERGFAKCDVLSNGCPYPRASILHRLRATTVPGWSSQLLLGIFISVETRGILMLGHPLCKVFFAFSCIFSKKFYSLSYYGGLCRS